MGRIQQSLKRRSNPMTKTVLITLIIAVILLLVVRSCRAEEIADYSVLLQIIASAESSHGKFLKGDNGKSLGRYHICKAVVTDYNKANGTNYKHKDLLSSAIDNKIASWHLRRIIRLLKIKKMYSKAKIIQVWNEGFIALKRKIPKTHRNKIYAGVYGEAR